MSGPPTHTLGQRCHQWDPRKKRAGLSATNRSLWEFPGDPAEFHCRAHRFDSRPQGSAKKLKKEDSLGAAGQAPAQNPAMLLAPLYQEDWLRLRG